MSLSEARERIVAAARQEFGQHYVCCCDAHSIACARVESHRRALASAFLATPDGMPLVWLGRRAGHRAITRVYGPDLLLAVCSATANGEYSHYFYGAGPGTAEAVATTLKQRFPGLRVVGAESPPFAPLTSAQVTQLRERLREVRPDFFWVALSTPLQEAFMAEQVGKLDVGIMLGVGAAFDFVTGRVRQAPPWIQRSGFEWLWRWSREPRRLSRRYLRTTPWFAWKVLLQQLSGTRSS